MAIRCSVLTILKLAPGEDLIMYTMYSLLNHIAATSKEINELNNGPRASIVTAADAATTTPQLRLWIIALSHVVSRLERVHSALVESVLSMPWTTMDSSFVKSYTSFVGMLVSAKPEYLTLVLGKIANGFTYRE